MGVEAAKAAVPVIVKGLNPNSGLLATLCIIGITGLGIVFKFLPKWREIGDARRKDEMDALRERVSELEAQIKTLLEHNEKADERAHAAELRYEREKAKADLKISHSAMAIQIMTGEIERLSPGNQPNPVIKQARELVAMAAVAEGNNLMPRYDMLANIPGTGE